MRHYRRSNGNVGNRACHRRSRIVCRREIYRRPGARGILFALIVIASAAQSFRSTCGCERGAPACSKQRFPEATRHVGQGSARNISGTKSLILIGTGCNETCRKTCSILDSMRTGHRKRWILPDDCWLKGFPPISWQLLFPVLLANNAEVFSPIKH